MAQIYDLEGSYLEGGSLIVRAQLPRPRSTPAERPPPQHPRRRAAAPLSRELRWRQGWDSGLRKDPKRESQPARQKRKFAEEVSTCPFCRDRAPARSRPARRGRTASSRSRPSRCAAPTPFQACVAELSLAPAALRRAPPRRRRAHERGRTRAALSRRRRGGSATSTSTLSCEEEPSSATSAPHRRSKTDV